MNTLDTVLHYIQKNNLTAPDDRIICGLSGGADSCAMVSLLHELAPTLGISLVCAHLNHSLRGDEAKRDELSSRAFAEKLGLPFYSETVDVSALAKNEGISLEDAGRRARYDFFGRVMAEEKANKIATAHNKNDNAETILMHIVRSSGMKGLCGIPPARENIIRPLLALSREEIEAYCAEKDIRFVTDSTNLESDYTRNKFRLEIIPALEEINPSVTEALCRLGEAAKSLQDFTEKQAERIPVSITDSGAEILLADLTAAHPSLYPELLKRALEGICCSEYISSNAVSAFGSLVSSGKTTGNTELLQGVTARLCYDRVIISREEKTTEFEYTLTDTLTLYGKQIFITASPPPGADIIPWDGTSQIKVRNRRPGDKMKIRSMTRKLQDLFVNAKIDRILRDKLLIITFGDTVVWAEKIGKDDSALNAQSEKYIVIKPED